MWRYEESKKKVKKCVAHRGMRRVLELAVVAMVLHCVEESVVYIFFFQAEDGIRDVAVTGVQTCALPISAVTAPALANAVFAATGKRIRKLPLERQLRSA